MKVTPVYRRFRISQPSQHAAFVYHLSCAYVVNIETHWEGLYTCNSGGS